MPTTSLSPFLSFIIVLLGLMLGLVISGMIGTSCLKLSGRWLNFGEIPHRVAARCAYLANFTVAVIQFSIGFNYGLIGMASKQDYFTPQLIYSFSPTYFLYAVAFGLALTAVIFRRLIPREDGEPLTPFGDSFALAAVYSALSLGFGGLLGLIFLGVLEAIIYFSG